jgi:putative membrane protein
VLRFLIRSVITGVAAFGVAYFSSGSLLVVKGVLAGVIFAIVLGLVNGVLRPILQLIALPLSILTLGVAALLINLGCFYIAAGLTPGVEIVGFWPSVIAALIIAVFNSIAAWMTERSGD